MTYGPTANGLAPPGGVKPYSSPYSTAIRSPELSPIAPAWWPVPPARDHHVVFHARVGRGDVIYAGGGTNYRAMFDSVSVPFWWPMTITGRPSRSAGPATMAGSSP